MFQLIRFRWFKITLFRSCYIFNHLKWNLSNWILSDFPFIKFNLKPNILMSQSMEPDCIAEQLNILNYCFEPSKMEVIQDCEASKIIWSHTKPELISWESNRKNPLFKICVGVLVVENNRDSYLIFLNFPSILPSMILLKSDLYSPFVCFFTGIIIRM